MPDYVYYIIGVALAIFIMALIIAINSKPSKKKEDCKCEVKEEKVETSTEEKVEKEEQTEEVKDNQPKEQSEVEENKQVEEQPKEEQPQEKTTKEEPKKEETEISKKERLNRYRVTYDKEQENWVVKMDGAERASRRCATKEEALKVAKELAEKKDASLSVHKKDGKFQKKANT